MGDSHIQGPLGLAFIKAARDTGYGHCIDVFSSYGSTTKNWVDGTTSSLHSSFAFKKFSWHKCPEPRFDPKCWVTEPGLNKRGLGDVAKSLANKSNQSNKNNRHTQFSTDKEISKTPASLCERLRRATGYVEWDVVIIGLGTNQISQDKRSSQNKRISKNELLEVQMRDYKIHEFLPEISRCLFADGQGNVEDSMKDRIMWWGPPQFQGVYSNWQREQFSEFMREFASGAMIPPEWQAALRFKGIAPRMADYFTYVDPPAEVSALKKTNLWSKDGHLIPASVQTVVEGVYPVVADFVDRRSQKVSGSAFRSLQSTKNNKDNKDKKDKKDKKDTAKAKKDSDKEASKAAKKVETMRKNNVVEDPKKVREEDAVIPTEQIKKD